MLPLFLFRHSFFFLARAIGGRTAGLGFNSGGARSRFDLIAMMPDP